jgi:hypothetical protein
MEEMAQLYAHEAVELSAVAGREAVCRLTDNEQEIAVYIGALKRFTRHAAVNTIGLRRSIAQKVLAVNAYPVKA